MKLLDLTLATPADNLACDEALLDWCEDGHCPGEILRFLGTGPALRRGRLRKQGGDRGKRGGLRSAANSGPRRCSGGGTVLQGPGCLNYALILRITDNGPFRNVGGQTASSWNETGGRWRHFYTTSFPLTRPGGHRLPIGWRAERGAGFPPLLEVRGHTDLTMNGLKFSGNSQRRRKNYLLFHGTFLLNFDLQLVSALLRMPSNSWTIATTAVTAVFDESEGAGRCRQNGNPKRLGSGRPHCHNTASADRNFVPGKIRHALMDVQVLKSVVVRSKVDKSGRLAPLRRGFWLPA